jgi:hypothetical protein
MKLRHALLGCVAYAGAASAALAQVNAVPQVGLTTGYLAKVTYSSAFFGLVPVTAGTDIICIAGSATKTVRIQQINIFGSVATATQNLPVNLLRRATVDTGGTAATTTANPGVATQIASRDTGQALNTSSTATLISYTANPTITDTAPVYLDSQTLFLPLTTTASASSPAQFSYYDATENLIQLPTLRGIAQQICVNIAGVTLTNAVTLNGSIIWTEE